MTRIFGSFKRPWVLAMLAWVLIGSIPVSALAMEPGLGQSLRGPAALIDALVKPAGNGGVDVTFSGTCGNNVLNGTTFNVSAITFSQVELSEGQVFVGLENFAALSSNCGQGNISTININVHGYSDDGSEATFKAVALFNHG